MAFFNEIAIEIQALAAGVLILLVITILELVDLGRGKKQHRQDLLSIDSGVAIGNKARLVSLFSLITEFVFGFAACALFIYGALHFVAADMPVFAIAASVAALIALTVPFIVWHACRKANQETADILEKKERGYQEAAARQRQTPPAQVEQPVASPIIDPPALEPVAAASVEVPVSQPVEVAPPKPIAVDVPAAKPYTPARPTDSMLRRHYDAMLAARSGAMPAPAAAQSLAPSVGGHKCCHKTTVKIPQDSMLRRHFLSTLQLKIEAHLPSTARPTDSMLRRHYDTTRANWVAAKMRKYSEG